ncbi:MAG: peptidase S10, partial [Rhodopirellula sp. JB053]
MTLRKTLSHVALLSFLFSGLQVFAADVKNEKSEQTGNAKAERQTKESESSEPSITHGVVQIESQE